MFFKDIAGQKATKLRLIESHRLQRIPHAMLFSGPEGNGKMALAIAFSRYIACKNRTETDACGTCSSCLKFNKLEHPDLHFVFPVVKKGSKTALSDDFIAQWRSYLLESPYVSIGAWMNFMGAENKQPIIYTEESESIVKKASTKSYEGDYKYLIIYYPERMHVSCANKLLKMIEEPPEKTLFILVSENAELLLTTIISRCQTVNIPAIKNEDLRNYLLEREQVDSEHIDNLIHLSEGSYIKAIETLRQSEQNVQNLELFIYMMRKAYMRDIVPLKKWCDDVVSLGREGQKSFLAYTQRLIRENFILNLHTEALSFMNKDEHDFSKKFAPFVNERNVIKIYEELDLAARHIEQNVNGKMVFFDLCLKMIMLLKS